MSIQIVYPIFDFPFLSVAFLKIHFGNIPFMKYKMANTFFRLISLKFYISIAPSNDFLSVLVMGKGVIIQQWLCHHHIRGLDASVSSMTRQNSLLLLLYEVSSRSLWTVIAPLCHRG